MSNFIDKTNMDNNKLVSPQKAGEILGVSRETVLTYINAGILRSIRYTPTGRHRIKVSDLLALKEGK